MQTSRRVVMAGLASLPALGAAASRARAQASPTDGPLLTSGSWADVLGTAVEAYIFGYPLVTVEMTKRLLTNVAAPEGTRAPLGQFANLREYPNASFKAVTAPNADTLYSSAFVDLSKEPFVFSIPNMDDRYFLTPMLSAWTDVFAVPGKRTTGTSAQTYLLAGPGWSGNVPTGVKLLVAPTNLVWILGRTYCTGTPEDYKLVHAIQDKYELVPLSSFGKPYTPPRGTVDSSIDARTPVRDQVDRMDGPSYFGLLAELMASNPPSLADGVAVARLASLGVSPGQPFRAAALPAEVRSAIEQAPAIAQQRIMAHLRSAGVLVNGWTFTLNGGDYGKDYLQRALITAIGLGCNLPQDAVYPTSTADPTGRPYDGQSKYVMRFPPGQLPPVNGFWSLTMYDDAYFFVDNPLNRYTVSPRDQLKSNPDGSVDLLIQHASPGADRESNWLPAPPGRFILMLRTYWPKGPLLDGSWTPPPVLRTT